MSGGGSAAARALHRFFIAAALEVIMRGRQRIRIRDIKQEAMNTAAKAQATLNRADIVLSHADRAILEVQAQGMKTLALGMEIAERVLDGKAVLNLQVGGVDWPVGVRLDLGDDDDEDEPQAEKAGPPAP